MQISRIVKDLGKIALNYKDSRRSLLRQYAFGFSRSVTPLVAINKQGTTTNSPSTTFLVSTADTVIGRDVFVYESFDAPMMRRAISQAERHLGVEKLLQGKIFVDVGANIGTTVISAIRDFGAAAGLAFEMETRTFQLLRCNLILNGLEAVVDAHQLAITDHGREVEIEISDVNWGDNRVRTQQSQVPNLYQEGTREVRRVGGSRLEDVLELSDLENVGMVWIDTNGHEASVLSGAPSLLNSRVPVVLEYWPYGLRRSDSVEQLHQIIRTNFSYFVDLRTDAADPISTGEVDGFMAQLQGTEHADLLLLS